PPAYPTVQMSLGDVPATPFRMFSASFPFTEGKTLHDVPSQCSVSVPPEELPTAQTSLAEIAVVALSSFERVPGLGLGTAAHWLPLHRSITVGPAPFDSSACPTTQAGP